MSLKRAICSGLLLGFSLLTVSASSALAATVLTDQPEYPPGDTVVIMGSAFLSGEDVRLQVFHLDVACGDPWYVKADGSTSFSSMWEQNCVTDVGEMLEVQATGLMSGAYASATFLVAPTKNLDQFQNGTSTAPENWSNGNINSSNSCYSEGASVPYRYFILDQVAGDEHYFTIQMEWTKDSVHAFDYLTDYDFSEADAIDSAGGPCGSISTSPPGDCTDPTNLFAWPDFTDSANYTGTITADFFPSGFALDGPRNLASYHATVDSVSQYLFGGSASDRTLEVTVYYTVTTTGSVGFYWGGHLASGTPSTWGIGFGSASVSGAPYHMRALSFDGGGGAGQDRSVQNGSICLPPQLTITCAAGSLDCTNLSSSCSVLDSADVYDWTVVGGTIDSGQGTNQVYYTATASDSVIVSVSTCNQASECGDSYCCSGDTAIVYIESNNSPTIALGADTSVLQCTPAEICVSYSVSDPDGASGLVETLVSGPGTIDTLNNQVCFTPGGAGSYEIVVRVTDPCGAWDEDTVNVTVTLNQPPTATCPGDTTAIFSCEPGEICIGPFSASDPEDGIVASGIVPNALGGSFDGTTYCFTPADSGSYTIQYYVTDDCGLADTCSVTVTVQLANDPPVASCPSDTSISLCAPEEICVGPFVCSDPDGNLEFCNVGLGTWSGTDVCFTPDTAGVYTIQLVAIDSCGLADTCQTQVTVSYNQPPTIAFGDDFTAFQCYPEAICLPYTVSDPDGLAGVVETLVSGSGTIDTLNNQVCFTPTAAGNYTFVVRATDPCGASDEDTIVVTIVLNTLPWLTVPGPDSLFLCTTEELCYTIDFGDDDVPTYHSAPQATLLSGPGSLSGMTICFTPVDGVDSTYWFVIEVCDSCGSPGGVAGAVPPPSCVTDSFSVTVRFNKPPTPSCPGDRVVSLCDPEQICVGPFDCSDPDGNLESSAVNFGTPSGSDVCFTPDTAGVYAIVWTCTDSCGVSASCTTLVTVEFPPDPSLNDSTLTVILCEPSRVCFELPDPGGVAPYTWTWDGAAVSGDSLCIDFTDDAVIVGTLSVTDDCGHTASATWTINATVNTAPVISISAPSPEFVCEVGDTVCVPFSVVDPDDGLVGTSQIGWVDLTDSTVCFEVDTAGHYCDQFIIADSCGLADTATFCVDVSINRAPEVSCPADTSWFLCEPAEICVGPFTSSDADDNLVSCDVSFGELRGTDVCFTPDTAGLYTIQYVCVDECGAADTCETNVRVNLNRPPDAPSCPADYSLTLCTPEEICVGPFAGGSDPDGNLKECYVSFGLMTGDQVCFTPDTAGTYTITYTCVDSCDVSVSCETNITIDFVPPPSIDDARYTVILCEPETRCFVLPPITGGQGPFSWTSDCSGIVGDSLCLDIAKDSTYTCELTVTDACGNSDVATVTVEAVVNDKPVVTVDAPSSYYACDPAEEVCAKLTIVDPDDGITITSDIGTVDMSDSTVCFPAGDFAGTTCNTVIVTDSCGLADTVEYCVDVFVNSPPTVECANDTIGFLCEAGDTICVGPFSYSDPDDNVSSESVSLGELADGIVCFMPDTAGTYEIVYTVTDECGESASCTTIVYLGAPILQLDTISVLSNSTVEVCLRFAGLGFPWGGFDFLVNYDATVLTLQNVTPGNFIEDCGWEYFAYRLVSTNPGLVRVVGIADMNNSNKHPSCLTPDSGDVIACFEFKVSNDRSVACQSVPLRFWWNDCADNTVSDPSGNILYIAGEDPFTVIDAEGRDLTGLVNVGGPPIPCPADKYEPFPCVQFQNGKIRIICPPEIDGRGDMNLNGLAYEIADAVLYSSYLIYGSPVLDPAYFEAQIAASDVNADGNVLTVADLVFLIRVITGDVEPLPDGYVGTKIAPVVGSLQIATTRGGGTVVVSARSDQPLGAALFVFAYDEAAIDAVHLTGRATDMDVEWQAKDGELRVLVFNIGEHAIAAGSGSVLEIDATGGDVKLVSVEAAAYNGGALETVTASKVRPERFALYQNYPNPFNPNTAFAVDLPTESDYALTIYNITGQVVRSFHGHAEAGRLSLQWDGTNEAGAKVASGLYLYRLQAGPYDAVRKMVLMK